MNRSFFTEKLTAYLSIREALGIQIQSKLILYDFVDYLNKHNSERPIIAQTVLDWVCDSTHVRGVSAQYARLGIARGFLIHLKASLPETEIPDLGLIARPRRPKPYIFSADELRELITATRELGTRTHWSIHTHAAETLFALMSCTGLRSSEAIKLTISDLELNEVVPRLVIRHSKFHKSRLVPLHSSTVDHLGDYLAWRKRREIAKRSDALFLSKKGQLVQYQCLRRLFLHVVKCIEIHPQPGQLAPSLHSLRHTFCVDRVRRWYEEGLDVQGLLPSLSVYLGHTDPSDSYWYLSSTPDLMNAASQRFESYTEQRSEI
jgi:integrase